MPAEPLPICDYEGSDYQTSFWERGQRNYEDQAEAVALRRLLPPCGDILLEIGAGAGRHTPRYQGFARVVLLDYSRSQLRQAKERLGDGGRYTYVVGDVYRLPLVPGLFDAATLIRTLHHLVDPPGALRQVREVLKPGAVLILEYANKQNLKAVLRYLFGRQSWSPFDPQPVEFARLNFDFHPGAVRAWLRDCQFHIERQLAVSYFRMPVLKKWVPLKMLVGLDALAQWSGAWGQFSPSVFVKARAVGECRHTPPETFFRCPNCGHFPLSPLTEALLCPACDRRWPIHDGLYDFRLD